MPGRVASKSVLTLASDGDRADDARRALLADWCRLVGRRLGDDATPLDAAAGPAPPAPLASAASAPPSSSGAPSSPADPSPAGPAAAVAALGLPRRSAQILTGLLAGGSEKQIALSLSISQHTVHTYVKQLHKRLNVSSRGELLARFIGGTS